MSVRVVSGEISTKGATTRVVVPTSAQPRWPPFERIGERIATSRRPFPPHRHERVEVFTYIVEGSATHQIGTAPPEALARGAAVVLTATDPISHTMNPREGQTVRWVAAVATIPPGKAAIPRIQTALHPRPEPQPEGTVLYRLLGPGAPLASAVGMECAALEFVSEETSFVRVGHDRVAACYALSGRGTVDNAQVEGGEAALIEDAAGAAIHGLQGMRVLIMTAPRTGRP